MNKDNISWDEYFMGVAVLSGHRSKDPRTRVGACIVDADKRIVGIGYNGMPTTLENNDDVFPWTSEGDWIDTKYPYVVHAEANAILNSTVSLKGATIYVKVFPCNECAKLIAQSGIKEVVYVEEYVNNLTTTKASKKIFDAVGITYRSIEFNMDFLIKRK